MIGAAVRALGALWAVGVFSTAHAGGNGSELQKALSLPIVREHEACPVNVGSRDRVPSERHIFGAGGVWFGAGPVYFALSWKEPAERSAKFSLSQVPRDENGYRAKTPWVRQPSYSGPVLIRGRALDMSQKALKFAVDDSGPGTDLFLRPRSAMQPLWTFWASSMWVPGPGCYGVQIDTLLGSEIVVFEAR
jgi:hypothetical protein